MMKNLHFLLALFILLLSACVGSAEPTLLPPSSPQLPSVTPLLEERVVQPEAAFPLPAKPLAQMAVLDLAARSAIPIEKITLLSVEAMEWSDAGIGCPAEGYDYTQVITPGYEIMLQAEGTLFTYHSDQGTFLVLCLDDGPESLPVIPIQPGEKIMDGIPWMPVDPIPTVIEGDSIADPDPIK
jgi:hypothetical protein